MSKHKLACALSATALFAGGSLIAPLAARADGDICTADFEAATCIATNLEELELGLLSSNHATDIEIPNGIVVSGESVDKTLVIDKNLTGTNNKENIFYVSDGAKLTLRGHGSIHAARYGAQVDGADLTIDGVEIVAINNAAYGVFALNNGRVTMESGSVYADYAAFAGNNTTGDMNFYVNGGMLVSERYPAIYMPGQVDLVVRGGTIDGGIVARMGQIVIEGGTINTQSTPVDGDGLNVNYNGMPSMSNNEAVTLVAGSYKSTTTEHGNDMNVTIDGDNVRINGDVVLYDLGNTADGYEQNVNVVISNGRLGGFVTKFTEDEIGFALKSGYTAGLNYENGRISTEITGGRYTAEPSEEDIAPDSEAEYNDVDDVYEIWPKRVDYANYFVEDDGQEEGHIAGFVEFGDKELIADRKASLRMLEVNAEELQLGEEGGELIGAFSVDMLDRYGDVIAVDDNDLTVVLEVSDDAYDLLSSYDHLQAVYFDEQGNEVERFDAEVTREEVGEDAHYNYLIIYTPHLSTYGIVGVNATTPEEGGEEGQSSSDAAAPNTGTMTVTGASATTAALVTSVAIGVIVSILSFAYLIRKR